MLSMTHRQAPGKPQSFEVRLTADRRESVVTISVRATDWDLLMLARHLEYVHEIHNLVAIRMLGILKRYRDRHRSRVRRLFAAGVLN